MRRPPAALALLLAACTVREVPGESTTSGVPDLSTSTSTTSTAIPTSTTTTTTPIPTTGLSEPATTTTQDSFDFVIKLDGPPENGIECDGYKQLAPECPSGEKCTLDGDFSRSHCVPIVRSPKGLNDPCTMMGDPLSGFDDCGLAMLCWYLDDQGHGTCIGLADGPADALECLDPNATLSVCGDCLFGYCLPSCDPLLADCPDGQLCIPVTNNVGFACVLDGSGDEGQVNDPCETTNGCDPGLMCLGTAAASSACMQHPLGCCQPFCDLTDNAPCPNPDQQCVQWFDPRFLDPGLEDVGVCAIPF